jgi:hypothetical protein
MRWGLALYRGGMILLATARSTSRESKKESWQTNFSESAGCVFSEERLQRKEDPQG